MDDAVLQGPVFVADFEKDFDEVETIVNRHFGDRFAGGAREDSRTLLDPARSHGSVIKLLTPASRDYTPDYNEWVKSVPQHIKELVFTVKRQYKPEWGDNWRSHFSVDIINGTPANELRCDGRRLISHFLRVGYDEHGAWRTFGLRKDFHSAAKVQMEDDITASVVVPSESVENLNPDYKTPAVKFAQNCEYRLFQRPDDAIHRGYDKKTEADFARTDNFFSNYAPLTADDAKALLEDSIGFDLYTAPMQNVIREAAGEGNPPPASSQVTSPTPPDTGGVKKEMFSPPLRFGEGAGGRGSDAPTFFVATSHPRIVDGKPTKNPRYLQTRPDLLDPQSVYLAEMGARMHRKIALDVPVHTPVNAVLPGRRNNPPEPGARPLCVFNPIHYLETPELFMEYISSMTGKSPSTTGAGSEGALTKAPFNALPPIWDLNAAYVSLLLTEAHGFVTAAGYVGPRTRTDHDVSLLVPELWCRMTVEERNPEWLKSEGYLEKCEDLDVDGQTIFTSRLGWRITRRFVRQFFGRIFSHPQYVFTDEMLRPENQDLAVIVDSMTAIVETHKRVAQSYFADGSIEDACPPLRALLHLMRDDEYDGKPLSHPEIRALFTREALLSSDWYAHRQSQKRAGEIALLRRHVTYLEGFLSRPSYAAEASRLGIPSRLAKAKKTLEMLGK